MSEVGAVPINPWWFLTPGLVWVGIALILVCFSYRDGLGLEGTASVTFMLTGGLFSVLYGLKFAEVRSYWMKHDPAGRVFAETRRVRRTERLAYEKQLMDALNYR